jgi:hypothetical protein
VFQIALERLVETTAVEDFAMDKLVPRILAILSSALIQIHTAIHFLEPASATMISYLWVEVHAVQFCKTTAEESFVKIPTRNATLTMVCASASQHMLMQVKPHVLLVSMEQLLPAEFLMELAPKLATREPLVHALLLLVILFTSSTMECALQQDALLDKSPSVMWKME